jgi:hypothetical protein
MLTKYKYILDAAGDPVPCDDLLTWARWFETADRQLAESKDEGADPDGVRVSTVFLALDHNYGVGAPVLWETMVFGGPLNGEMERYTSKAEAIAGHQRMCERVAAARPNP